MSKLFWAIFYISINLYAQNYVQEQIPWVPDYLQDQQNTCPQGYSFDYTSGNCVFQRGPSNSENCVENFETGEVECNNEDGRGKKKDIQDMNSPQDTYDQDEPSNSRCRSAYSAAKTKCDGNTFSQSPQSQSLVRTIQFAQISGNTRQACEASKQLNSVLWSLNANFGVQCNNAVKACASSCASNSAEHDHCLDLKGTVNLAKNQAIENAKAYAGSEVCAVAASGCGANSYDDKNCPQYCQKPGRQNDPLCKTQAQNNCLNPQYASQNTQFCQDCLQNPQACVKPQNAFAEQPMDSVDPLKGSTNSKTLGNSLYDSTGKSKKLQKSNTASKLGGNTAFLGNAGTINNLGTASGNNSDPKNTLKKATADSLNAEGYAYGVGAAGTGGKRQRPSYYPNPDIYSPRGIDYTQFLPPPSESEAMMRAKGLNPNVPSIKDQEIAYGRMELYELEMKQKAEKQLERKLASQEILENTKKWIYIKQITLLLLILAIGTGSYWIYREKRG